MPLLFFESGSIMLGRSIVKKIKTDLAKFLVIYNELWPHWFDLRPFWWFFSLNPVNFDRCAIFVGPLELEMSESGGNKK